MKRTIDYGLCETAIVTSLEPVGRMIAPAGSGFAGTLEGAMDYARADSDSRIEIERNANGSEAPISSTLHGIPARPWARPWPELAGQRLVSPGYPDIYVIDADGYRRCIPNHTTYNRLFRDWTGIENETWLDAVSLGTPLSTGTILARGGSSDPIYLLDNGRKRLIRDESVMEKYWFNWARVFSCRQALLDRLPLGMDWD